MLIYFTKMCHDGIDDSCRAETWDEITLYLGELERFISELWSLMIMGKKRVVGGALKWLNICGFGADIFIIVLKFLVVSTWRRVDYSCVHEVRCPIDLWCGFSFCAK